MQVKSSQSPIMRVKTLKSSDFRTMRFQILLSFGNYTMAYLFYLTPNSRNRENSCSEIVAKLSHFRLKCTRHKSIWCHIYVLYWFNGYYRFNLIKEEEGRGGGKKTCAFIYVEHEEVVVLPPIEEQ